MELFGSPDVIMLNFALWKMRKFHELYPSLITILTQHDSHGPDDHPKTIDYHYLDMSRDDGMDKNGIDWLCGCHHVGFWLGSWANGRWFCPALTTNPTQHDSHRPDDHTKTFDYHHLDMSRDDVMDENAIDWFSGCHHVEFCIMEDKEIS
jgi:hypothetical protein